MINLLKSVIGNSTFKVIDSRNGFQRWHQLKIKNVELNSESTNSLNPLAATPLSVIGVYDSELPPDLQSSKVVQPAIVKVSAFVEAYSLISSIIQVYSDTTHSLTLTSRGMAVRNMVLSQIDIIQSEEYLSAAPIEMTFEQISLSDPRGYNPAKDGDQNAMGVSIQSPVSLSDTVGNLYLKVKKTIGFGQ